MKTKYFMILGLMAVAVFSGCGRRVVRQEPSVVTVSGVGTVSVVPDMVRMTVTLERTAQTTKLAQEEVGRMAAQVLEILKGSGIENKDIMTASLRFSPQYEWRNNRNVLVGQRAEQGIDFAVREIGQDAEKVSRIIDRLTAIDGIMMNRIDFSVADNTDNFVRSRELAFEKAMQKAEQYAELSGLKVGRVLSLSEDGATPAAPLYRSTMVNEMKLEADMDAGSTVLPSGQMEVTTRISATFLLE